MTKSQDYRVFTSTGIEPKIALTLSMFSYVYFSKKIVRV